MNRATMVTRFKDRCFGLAGALTDAEVYVLLNEQYSYAIPDDIPGSISDSEWTVSTVDGTQDYAYPDFVHSVRRGATIADDPLRMIFRPAEMWARYNRSETSESRPYTGLFYEDTMTLVPIPDTVYTIVIPIRAYPNDGTNVLTLTSAGLTNDTHAKAVISGAAAEFLADSGDSQHAKEEWERRKLYMGRLRTRSTLPPRGRRARRSF